MFLLVLGEQWTKAADYFKILMVLAYGYPVSAIMISIPTSIGRSDMVLKLDIIKKIIAIPAFIVLFYFSIESFLWAKTITVFLAVLVNIFYICPLIGIKPFYIIETLLKQFVIIIIPFVITSMIPFGSDSLGMQILAPATVFVILAGGAVFMTQKELIKHTRSIINI